MVMDQAEFVEGVEGCISSPGLPGIDLMAAADGEASADVHAHLAACPACAARVAQLAAFQRELRQRLYRIFCPSTDLLVDYCQGLLEPHVSARLAHHIATCPLCTAEVALLEQPIDLPPSMDRGPETLLSARPSRIVRS